MTKATAFTLGAVVVLAAGPILAGETKGKAVEVEAKASEVPQAATDAVAAKYPKMAVSGWQKETDEGKTVFEAMVREGTRKIDVIVSPEGKILVEEEVIGAKEVPAAVQKGFAASKWGKDKVQRIERCVNDGKVTAATYEYVVGSAKDTHELVFDGAGKLVKSEEKEEKEDD